MPRVVVIIGSSQEAEATLAASSALPKSDQAAVGLAIQRFGGQVEAYCRHHDTEASRYALAAGAVMAGHLDDVTAVDFDIVLVGSGGAEPYGDLLLAQLAEQKQCAMVFDVLDVVASPAGLTVTRDLGRGSREVLALHGPAVLGIAEAAVQLLYVSRYRQQRVPPALLVAHTREQAEPPGALSSPWGPARPRVKTADLSTKTSGAASVRRQALFGLTTEAHDASDRAHIIVADASTCAQHLLRFLRHHGVIRVPETPLPASPRAAEGMVGGAPLVGTPIWEPHRRGPRPLIGTARGRERQPRPLAAVAVVRAAQPVPPTRRPRPVGAPASRSQRGPRPLDIPETNGTEG